MPLKKDTTQKSQFLTLAAWSGGDGERSGEKTWERIETQECRALCPSFAEGSQMEQTSVCTDVLIRVS